MSATNQTRRETLKNGVLATGSLVVGGPLLSRSAAATHGSGDTFERTDVREDLTGITFFNPCTEEDMEITQGMQLVTFFLRIKEEQVTLKYHVLWQGVEAIGLESEDVYRIVSNFNSFIIFSLEEESFPLATTIRFMGNTLSTGSEENWKTTLLLHTTINGNGDIIVDFTEGYIDTCY